MRGSGCARLSQPPAELGDELRDELVSDATLGEHLPEHIALAGAAAALARVHALVGAPERVARPCRTSSGIATRP